MPEDFEADEMMEEAPAKSVPKKGKSKLLILGIPIVLVQLIAAYFLVMYFFKEDMPEKEKVVEVKEVKEKEEFGIPYTISDMTINIPTDERRARYMVADFGFECESADVVTEMGIRDVQIRDIIIGIVSSAKIDQLMNNQFIQDTLKVDLRDRLNAILMKGSIKSVYLSQRVIN